MSRPTASIVAAALYLVAAGPAAAQDDRSRTDPTGWYWYYGQSPESLEDIVSQTGGRIIDIEVESAAPLTFTAALVVNQGAYAQKWWYYLDVTADDILSLAGKNGARVVDVETYDAGGKLLHAAVMVDNTGADSKSWWLYVQQSYQGVFDLANANGARIVDLNRHVSGKNAYYDAVMIANTGADASSWWFYVDLTVNDVSARIREHDARILDLEVYSAGGELRFDVVLVPNGGAARKNWWWYVDFDEPAFWSHAAQYGARPIDIETYTVGKQRRFAVVFLDNVNEMTSRLGTLLNYGTDGATGAYVKEVGGPVLAALQPDLAFEPASTIKALLHLHAMLQVDVGAASLDEHIPWCSLSSSTTSPRDGCPQAPCGETISLREALKQMMWVSDNRATDAVARRFGNAPINGTAASLGLDGTRYNHPIGCPAAALAAPNSLTLTDIGSLYEQVSRGLLDGTSRDIFYDLMSGRGDGEGATIDFTGVWGDLKRIINEEGGALGLSGATIEAFTGGVRLANKAGGYQLWNNSLARWDFFASLGGWALLPVCHGLRGGTREYVFGFYVDHAADVGQRFAAVRGELLREPIREALRSFGGGCLPAQRYFVRGDANLDRVLNLSDASFVLSYLFNGGSKVKCADAADVNDDGHMDISDATTLLGFLFLGGRLPPGTSAGKPQVDATLDQLGCDQYPQP